MKKVTKKFGNGGGTGVSSEPDKGNIIGTGASLNLDNYGKGGKVPSKIKKRLEELRQELRAENITYGELAELQSLAKYIDAGDVELLEAAGVEEKHAKGGELNSVYAHNGDLRNDWEKHQSADEVRLGSSKDEDANPDFPYILDVNDDSYFYAGKKDRDDDYKLAKRILKGKYSKGGTTKGFEYTIGGL